MFEVSVSAAFEAAHTLDVPGATEGYRVIHGHSFLVTATTGAEKPGPSGWVIDLGAFEQTLKEVLAPLDHSLLNDVPGLEKPTFESLLVWIDAKLRDRGIRPTRIEIERPILRQRAVYTPAR